VVERITIYVNHLVDGGAARVAVHLSRAWSAMGRKVTILTTDGGETPPCYELDPRVTHVPLGLQSDSRNALQAAFHNLSRVLHLRRALKAARPDVLVSFLDRNNVLCLLATRGLGGLPVLVSERTDPSARSIGRTWKRPAPGRLSMGGLRGGPERPRAGLLPARGAGQGAGHPESRRASSGRAGAAPGAPAPRGDPGAAQPGQGPRHARGGILSRGGRVPGVGSGHLRRGA